MSDPLKPPTSLLVKLGSIAVHMDEMIGSNGHVFDRYAMETALKDEETQKWLKDMTDLGLTPVKR